ncbi:MAG: hypothetical protein A3H93_16380 [Rhodocyclales bacterium RIFCSPLOWO2_02_FULL_63_24]|nr:MAG: hypothetical protein A2040_19970 [Rhodocyclales bacterium GWA2_65_19]OHC72543.1 MAG: hypothetical protein A3H93_16380 [Rhodocyclales bacterium RIFCSPLOWO2_02_FULL_63_24]
MKKSLSLVASYIVLTTAASAQQAAEWVETGGVGDLKRASDAMIAPKGEAVSIRIPTTVKKGEIIPIQYDDSGSTIKDSFMVTGISIKDDNCAIENKRSTKLGAELSDMIYAKKCKKLK